MAYGFVYCIRCVLVLSLTNINLVYFLYLRPYYSLDYLYLSQQDLIYFAVNIFITVAHKLEHPRESH